MFPFLKSLILHFYEFIAGYSNGRYEMNENRESTVLQVEDENSYVDVVRDEVPSTTATPGDGIDTQDLMDDSSDDADSAVGGMDHRQSTISVNPLVYDFVQENGHTYNRYKEGKYLLPNDEDEQKRQDMQHNLYLATLKGKLHLAPLKGVIRHVLDIATGTGIWATEFAQKYPTTNVIGTDLSPIQDEYVPRNCKFEIDDVEDGWTYRNPLDYIHGRQLHTCSGDFRSVVQKAFTALNPGGYIELQDSLPITCIDDSWNGTAIQRWAGKMAEGAKKLGVDWTKTSKYQQWMEDTGFEDIKEVELVWPTNYWPKDRFQKGLGQLTNEVLKQGLHGYSIKILTDAHGMNATEISVLLKEVEKDLDNKSIHCYVPIRIIYGRKPE